MSEMVYGMYIEGSEGYASRVAYATRVATRFIDKRRNDSMSYNMAKMLIEEYIKPELKEHGIVSKNANEAFGIGGQSGVMNLIYSFACKFGLNAKISYEGKECMYSFWYPND